MTWPTAAEVRAALKSAGFTALVLDATLDQAVDDAVAQWENHTGWHPFVGGASTVARTFEVTAGQSTLYLDVPLRTSTAPTIQANGSDLSASLTAWWLPRNASIASLPYTALEMRTSTRRAYIPSGIVTITGLWGWCDSDTVPTDARAAVLAEACRDIATAQTSLRAVARDGETADDGSTIVAPITRAKEGDVDLEFSTTQTERMAILKSWEETFARTARRYKAVRVY